MDEITEPNSQLAGTISEGTLMAGMRVGGKADLVRDINSQMERLSDYTVLIEEGPSYGLFSRSRSVHLNEDEASPDRTN